MRYSLIIPHFADTDRLERLLHTVPADRPDIEIIVTDDCSPDRAAIEAAKTRWPNALWLSTAQNSGAGAARNVGLARATGDYLVFADSDDEFLPGAFNRFDQHLNPDDELVYFLAEAVQEADGSPSNRADRMNELCRRYYDDPSPENRERLQLGHVNPVAKVYARSFVARIGVVFEQTRVGNDVAFNVLAAVQARHLRVVPAPVYRIFRRSGSLTTSEDIDTLSLKVRSLARLNQRLASLDVHARMHAGSYLYRALIKGPAAFLQMLRVVITSGMLGPTLRHMSISEILGFIGRARQARAEKTRY